MPIGSFSFSPGGIPLGGQAVPIGVFLFDAQSGLSLLPNIMLLQCSTTEGDDPPTARFAYITDDRAAAMGWPTEMEQLWPLNLPGGTSPYVVVPGDRICAYAAMPDGTTDLLFDGFARMPQADVAGDQQAVTFSAVDVAIRCYDIPIEGRIQRDGGTDEIEETDGSQDVATNLPTRFNPQGEGEPTGQPNCTPEGLDTDPDGDGAGVATPVFLDENIDRPDDPDHSPRMWTLANAIKYLLAVYNPTGVPQQQGDDPGEFTYKQFVQNPDFSDLDVLLNNRRPTGDGQFYNPDDPSTYVENPIILRDFDATNMGWPEAVSRLLGYHGFGMRWLVGQGGSPNHTFEVYRKDAGNADTPKVAYLAPRPSPVSPAASNVAQMTAAFDYHGLANSFVIETHPNRYEISIVIPPLFEPIEGDEAADIRKDFFRSNLDDADEDVRRMYRWYGADEVGDGFWSQAQKKMVLGTPFDFSSLWPSSQDPVSGQDIPGYVQRFRPGIRDLISDDGNGDKLKAQLALSRNYAGKSNDLWDGTGDWQPIEGDWELLDDRLGIRFTADDPEAIHIGKANKGAKVQNSGSVLKGVTSIAKPGTSAKSNTYFYLRLTVVIEGDRTVEGRATRRLASPMANEIRRRINAKDHFRKDSIDLSSANYDDQKALHPDWPVDPDTDDLLARDDTDAANDFAAQLRAAHESPSLPATITIPWLTFAYDVGDRIGLISGRNMSLCTNAGLDQGEAPNFPYVIGVTHDFSGDSQKTTLQTSDRRLEPQPIEHRRGR